jgi:putative restriction endonuclease
MPVFGEIAGYLEGSTFANRDELLAAGVHRQKMAGIAGTQADGADSIVVNGGYEDDEDRGDIIIYTGHGGNSAGSQVRMPLESR